MTAIVDRDRTEGPEDDTAGMRSPAPQGGLVDVFRHRYILKLLVRREIQARYQGSVLGLLWSYVQPATRFVMYYFVIGLVMGLDRGVEYFGIHMFAGMVFVHYFTETFTAGTRSIMRNSSIVKKMAMPREMFPVASMLVSAYHIIPQLIILVSVCMLVGWSPDLPGFLAGLLGFAIVAVMGTSLALLFSAANVFARDFSNIVQTLTNFVHLAVPMIYPFTLVASRFGAEYVNLYLANPLAEAVLLIQRCFWVGVTEDPEQTALIHMPDWLFTRGLIQLAACLVFLLIAQLVFTRLERKFPERL
jgi:ABC-2 type transport system permease protein|nr:ABC transporter permease [uncultured Nocardioides sp.]